MIKGSVLGAEVREAAGDQIIESFTDHIKEETFILNRWERQQKWLSGKISLSFFNESLSLQ